MKITQQTRREIFPPLVHDICRILYDSRDIRHRYGGLTRTQILACIRRYQAAYIDLAPFLIMCAWRHCPPRAKPAPALLQATTLFMKQAVASGTPRMLRHAAHATAFFNNAPPGTITREHFGHVSWWKLLFFQYILAYPKPLYAIREFHQHLRLQKLEIDKSCLRRLCTRHGIARDMRGGRPKKITLRQKIPNRKLFNLSL